MNVNFQKRSVRGFTLVELLVVLGIIAILVAISFPLYRTAIGHANLAKCSSNLRQIGTGMVTFAGDNDGNLPVSGGTILYGSMDGPPPAGSGQYSWTQQLEPYVGTDKTVFTCPDSFHSIPENNPYSYFNGSHAAYAESGGFAPVKLSKIHALSQTIMGGDVAVPGLFQKIDADKDDYTSDPAFNGGTKSSPKIIPIHMGSVNILFADGHVENLKYFDPTVITTVYQGPGAAYDYGYPH